MTITKQKIIKYLKKIVLCIIIGFLSGGLLNVIVDKYSIRTIKVLSGDTLEITSSNKFVIFMAHNISAPKIWKINLNDRTIRIKLDGVDCLGLKIRRNICRGKETELTSIDDVKEISKQATENLKKILSRHPQNITFKTQKIDRYGRRHGILYADGININKYMLDKGGCWAKTTAAYEEMKCMFGTK